MTVTKDCQNYRPAPEATEGVELCSWCANKEARERSKSVPPPDNCANYVPPPGGEGLFGSGLGGRPQ